VKNKRGGVKRSKGLGVFVEEEGWVGSKGGKKKSRTGVVTHSVGGRGTLKKKEKTWCRRRFNELSSVGM